MLLQVGVPDLIDGADHLMPERGDVVGVGEERQQRVRFARPDLFGNSFGRARNCAEPLINIANDLRGGCLNSRSPARHLR